MDITTWITYIMVISALIVIPGPSSILVTLHGAHYGYRKANFTIAGTIFGALVLMSLSALGLSALLISSEVAFSIAKYSGATCLIYLGFKTMMVSGCSNSRSVEEKLTNKVTHASLLKSGFLTGVSNPKDLIFFAGLFPAFLNHTNSIMSQLFILMGTWLFVDYLFKILYLLIGGKMSNLFLMTNFRNWFNRLTGGIFIGFGVLLASHSKH